MALKTITVKGRGIGREGVAGGAITPGHLVKLNSAGAVIAHNVAGGDAVPLFARENELAGKGIDTAYASNERVFYEALFSGCEVNALVAPSAAAIVVGDLLVSDGAGGLRKRTAVPDAGASPNQTTINAAVAAAAQKTIAIALQAVDNSANAVTSARILVEVI